jgi:hypothetical protein
MVGLFKVAALTSSQVLTAILKIGFPKAIFTPFTLRGEVGNFLTHTLVRGGYCLTLLAPPKPIKVGLWQIV